jgi:hypothetical protein
MEPPSPAASIKNPKRIDLDDSAEVQAWCALLKLSADDLRTAVNTIGPMSAAVAVYVNSRGRRGAMRQVGEIGHPFERHGEEPIAEASKDPKASGAGGRSASE